ncbi:glycoside hydrolase family 18 protein [Nannocystis pusilla]|uniref:chitinase n=1 Tax=Nannocystis pusilla TaxID=889268 RepID=A0A9X3IX96_9BACT|nr:glycoside hydrolase family 18 protein [Nannocystis pusilla]MCY1005578.1 glycoside hydrolase family 18 protein [Nannocystis pusilla]
MSGSTGSGPTSDASTAATDPATSETTAGPTGTATDSDSGEPTGTVTSTTGDPPTSTTVATATGPGTTTDDTTTTTTTTGDPVRGSGRIVGYFTAWAVYDRDYHVSEIPADKLTHVNYAFANLSAQGECVLGDSYADIEKAYDGDDPNAPLKGSFNQLQKLKQQHGHLRTLISVGGYTWSTQFAPAAATEQGRAKLAASCVKFMRDYGFDGVDIDWEFPASPQEGQHYSALLAALRAELDAAEAEDGAEYLLTIAAPAGPGNLANLDLPGIAASVDWINLMAYDFAGPWMGTTTHNAALYSPADDPDPNNALLSDDSAVTAILDAGVAPDQLRARRAVLRPQLRRRRRRPGRPLLELQRPRPRHLGARHRRLPRHRRQLRARARALLARRRSGPVAVRRRRRPLHHLRRPRVDAAQDRLHRRQGPRRGDVLGARRRHPGQRPARRPRRRAAP